MSRDVSFRCEFCGWDNQVDKRVFQPGESKVYYCERCGGKNGFDRIAPCDAITQDYQAEVRDVHGNVVPIRCTKPSNYEIVHPLYGLRYICEKHYRIWEIACAKAGYTPTGMALPRKDDTYDSWAKRATKEASQAVVKKR